MKYSIQSLFDEQNETKCMYEFLYMMKPQK